MFIKNLETQIKNLRIIKLFDILLNLLTTKYN